MKLVASSHDSHGDEFTLTIRMSRWELNDFRATLQVSPFRSIQDLQRAMEPYAVCPHKSVRWNEGTTDFLTNEEQTYDPPCSQCGKHVSIRVRRL